jgi:pilus assembly protein Flp/PilA
MYWYLMVKNWIEEQKGQDMAEYALLIALIAIAAFAALGTLSTGVNKAFTDVAAKL